MSHLVEYPQEFIERVRAEISDWEYGLKLLETGDIKIGEYLESSSRLFMSPEEIVTAFNEGRQNEVKKVAEKCIRYKKLYSEWVDYVPLKVALHEFNHV